MFVFVIWRADVSYARIVCGHITVCDIDHTNFDLLFDTAHQ